MYKIYQIVDNTNGNVYIGKTIKIYLSQRLSNHTYYTRKNTNRCMSREIIKNGNYKIELIEETPDETRERYWIENTECINRTIPGRTRKEYQKDNKEKIKKHQKNYYENHKDKILTRRKNSHLYSNSWGGDRRSNNNLLLIDPKLFI